jgi:urate oxidase
MGRMAGDRYGKARVRLMKVRRSRDAHELVDWTLSVLFKGDFEKCFTDGDNSMILPTDTMKNTVYSMARRSAAESMEEFAIELSEFFLDRNPHVTEVGVEISEKIWTHANVNGVSHPTTFVQSDQQVQTARLTRSRGEPVSLTAGLKNLVILKTANSGFEGFLKDELTTLQETSDRLFGTEIGCTWTYSANVREFNQVRWEIRRSLVARFAEHESKSVQHTLFAVAEAVLEQNSSVAEISIMMPNRHCLLFDLSRFGQDNPNEIFVPIDEPHGYIEATVRR